MIRGLFRRLLGRLALSPEFACSVAEARLRLQELDGLDLLITDTKLPDGTGAEVIAAAVGRLEVADFEERVRRRLAEQAA